jgi:HlyD family secretion protein
MDKAQPNRAGVVLLWAAGLAVVIGIVFAVRSLTREQVTVRVVPVTYQTLVDTVSTNGKVEPVEEYQAHAPGPGVIQKIFVEVGEKVTPGTLLVKMDDSEAKARVATAKASLTAARLALRDIEQGGSLEERSRFSTDAASARLEQSQAESNLAQVLRLQQKGAASAAEVASAQQRLDAANLTLKSASGRSTTRYTAEDRANAQAHVSEAVAALAAAQSLYNNANIRSPIRGTVYSVPFSQYDFVPSGADDLLDVADLNRIRVRAYFDEPEIGKLARGQAVKIVWDAKQGVVWHGHIESAPTTVITYGTRNVGECNITVDDAKGDLLPNTNVTVTVTRMQRFNVLSIPREALHTDGSKDFVFRIVDHKLARTPVQVGVVNLTNVEVTSGLKGNDIVVLGPTASGKEMTNGLEVKQVE